MEILKLFLFCSVLSVHATVLKADLDEAEVLRTLELPVKDRVNRLKQSSYARELLAKIAQNDNHSLNQRWRAITSMGYMGAKSFRWEIDAALRSRHWFIRDAGLVAVLRDERDRALRWSLRLLSDPAMIVRTQAAENLILLNAFETKEAVWKSFNDSMNGGGTSRKLWIRKVLAKAIAKWAERNDEKRLLKMLLDSDEEVEQWAVYGLEKVKGLKLTNPDDPIELKKKKWLSRLSDESI